MKNNGSRLQSIALNPLAELESEKSWHILESAGSCASSVFREIDAAILLEQISM